MIGRLFLVFLIVPFVELYLLLRVGSVIGFWPTVGLVLLTAMAGAALARRQGLKTLMRIQEELARGRMPTTELADGALILLAGALLVTPGFLTDVFALCLLFPPTRRVFRRVLSRYFIGQVAFHAAHGARDGGQGSVRVTRVVFDDGREERGEPMKYVENEAR